MKAEPALVMALCRLLSSVNESRARLVVGLVLVSVAITFANAVNNGVDHVVASD